MKITAWLEKYPKKIKPKDSSLNDFWSVGLKNIFYEFSQIIANKHGVSITQWSYTSKYGWKLRGCIKSVVLIKDIIIFDEGFSVDNIIVKNQKDILSAIEYVASLYSEDFIQKQNDIIEKRNKKQIELTKIACLHAQQRSFLMSLSRNGKRQEIIK